ncbi:MAG: TLD domain-containing protein [bacterium]
MIYRGSRDGFKAAVFHQKVDNQGPHVVLIISKEHNQIFGAWTDISMTSSDAWKAGNGNTFLFKYTNTNQFHKLKCKDKSYEANHNPDRLSQFG